MTLLRNMGLTNRILYLFLANCALYQSWCIRGLANYPPFRKLTTDETLRNNLNLSFLSYNRIFPLLSTHMQNQDPSDEDKALFRQMMRDVKPMQTEPKAPKEKVPPKVMPVAKHTLSDLQKTSYLLSDNYQEVMSAESTLSYCHYPIPKKRFLELKKGEIPWQSQLDLHGCHREQAKQSLCDFLIQNHELGHRCLLIIHGKGSAHTEAPILKNLVNHWLKQLPQVLAFHSALPKDGGNGALYVLLKRLR